MSIVASWALKHIWKIATIIELVALVSVIAWGVSATEGARKNLEAAKATEAECNKAFTDFKGETSYQREQDSQACRNIVDATLRDCELIDEANKKIDIIYETKPNVIANIKDMSPNKVLNDINDWLKDKKNNGD